MAAVANRLQNSDEIVVEHKAERAKEIDAEVRGGFRQYLVRRLHPHEHARCQQKPCDHQRQSAQNAKSYRRVNRLLELFYFLRAVVPCDHHTSADCKSVKKPDQQKNQAARRADRRQGIAPKQISDDQRVRRIVELLKQIAQKKRKCKRTSA